MAFESASKHVERTEVLQNYQNKDWRMPQLWGPFTPESPGCRGDPDLFGDFEE